MPTSQASAEWTGKLKDGSGKFRLPGAAVEGEYGFASRFEGSKAGKTDPEELIAAAHASCFSMALAAELGKAGHSPERVATTAQVELETVDGKPTVTTIRLETRATVPGIADDDFQTIAAAAKQGCPISRLLAAASIELSAKLD